MAYTKISYELKGDIAVISFDDPSTLNACGVDTAQELLHAFEVAASVPARISAPAVSAYNSAMKAPSQMRGAPSQRTTIR